MTKKNKSPNNIMKNVSLMSIYICEKIAKSYLALPFLFNFVTSLLKKSHFPAVFSILQPKLPESHSDFLVCYTEREGAFFGAKIFWKKNREPWKKCN